MTQFLTLRCVGTKSKAKGISATLRDSLRVVPLLPLFGFLDFTWVQVAIFLKFAIEFLQDEYTWICDCKTKLLQSLPLYVMITNISNQNSLDQKKTNNISNLNSNYNKDLYQISKSHARLLNSPLQPKSILTFSVMPRMTSTGSITLPKDLLILRPWASRNMAWRYTCLWKVTLVVNYHTPSNITLSTNCIQYG